jgi:hypothetical protein
MNKKCVKKNYRLYLREKLCKFRLNAEPGTISEVQIYRQITFYTRYFTYVFYLWYICCWRRKEEIFFAFLFELKEKYLSALLYCICADTLEREDILLKILIWHLLFVSIFFARLVYIIKVFSGKKRVQENVRT